ncbi:MAG: hypothetical protein ABW189_08810 [Rickettsiales bacterium]
MTSWQKNVLAWGIAATALCGNVRTAGAIGFETRIEPVGPKEMREYQAAQTKLATDTLDAQQKTFQAITAISQQLEAMRAGAASKDASAGGIDGDLEKIRERLKEISERADKQNALTKELISVMQEQLRLNRSLFAFLGEGEDGTSGDASSSTPQPGMRLDVTPADPLPDVDGPESTPKAATPEVTHPGATWIVK